MLIIIVVMVVLYIWSSIKIRKIQRKNAQVIQICSYCRNILTEKAESYEKCPHCGVKFN